MMATWLPISPAAFFGLTEDERRIALEMTRLLDLKRWRNELRRNYYEGHNGLRDLGISIPPQLRTVDVVVGWPAKAVNAMSRRVVLDSFPHNGGPELTALIDQIVTENRLTSEAPAAHTSALTHSCAFVFVSRGLPGQPEVVISAKPAEDATGIWDPVRRALSAALVIEARDVWTGAPTRLAMFLPGRRIEMSRNDRNIWECVPMPSGFDDVPVELLPYQPSLTRPFGRSRITRDVMYWTDAAVRTALRTEVSAEFYNAPQRYVLGADESAFEDAAGNPIPGWQVMLGRLLTLTRDEDGELPQVGTFSQQTMQPNIDEMRMNAEHFAAATDLPVSALGVVQDNPSSAEAMKTANENLGVEIVHWERGSLVPAWTRIMQRAVRAARNVSATTLTEAQTITAHFGKWWVTDEAAEADAGTKVIGAIPWLAETSVGLEMIGLDAEQSKRALAERDRAQSNARLDQLSALAQQPRTPQVPTQPVTPSGVAG